MPKVIEVSAKLGKDEGGASCLVNWNAGASLAEKVELFSESVVDASAESNMKVQLQAGLRRCLERGRDPQVYADTYVPGIRAASVTANPTAAAKAAFARMTPEEKAEFLQSLRDN